MGIPREIRLTTKSNMQKAKLSSSSKSKQMKSNWWKGKSAPSSPSLSKGFWTPESDNLWCNAKNKIVLSPTSYLHLTEMERLSLQKITLARLHLMNLGVPITIPKDGTSNKSKRSRFLLKRRAGSSSVIDSLRNNSSSVSPKDGRSTQSSGGNEARTSGWVFGIPLSKCISNDIELHRLLPSPQPTAEISGPIDMSHTPLRNRKSSSSSGGAMSNDESLSETDGRGTGGSSVRSNLIDALLLPVSSRLRANQLLLDNRPRCDYIAPNTSNSNLRIPYVVAVCCQHLQTHGLGVLGIFRIGSSKKRTIQLRDEFDTGQEVVLTEEHNPHDVGAVLKEFFRDLPDPLLTRSLYSAFVATRKLKTEDQRIRSVNLLISLLPPSNRDTLWSLLSFLNTIVRHSSDFIDEHGNNVPGNKMDAHNLATLFGPNILHKAKGGAFQVESLERAEERAEVIAVVKEMIEHQNDVFELSAELHDETLRSLLKTHPEEVDYLFQCRTMNFSVDADPESSSSICEESDCSSMPHSPSYSSEMDALHPRSLLEALQASVIPPNISPTPSRTLIEMLQSHTASTPSLPSIAMAAVGIGSLLPATEGHRLSALETSLTSPERSPPSPAKIEITTDLPDGRRVAVTGKEDDPAAPNRTSLHARRSSGVPHGPKSDGSSRRSSTENSKKYTLMVPPTKIVTSRKDSSGRDSDISSRGSSISPCPSSSPSPEPQWSIRGDFLSRVPSTVVCCSPSETLEVGGGGGGGGGGDNPSSSYSVTRSSSKHRPLGLSATSYGALTTPQSSHSHPSPRPSPRSSPRSVGSSTEMSPDWLQKTRWLGWDNMNKQNGEELKEQETLV